MTEKRVCLHCGDKLTKETQKSFCSREHFREFSKARAAETDRRCLYCQGPLVSNRKSFCCKEHMFLHIKEKNEAVIYTDMKCRHCGGFIPAAKHGRLQNKLFCNAKHRQEFNEARRAEKAGTKPPIPPREPRYCEHPGCENVLPTANRRYCCLEHMPIEGIPSAYTEEQADQIRALFFSGQLGLRETAVKVGVSLGVVTRVVYRKSPGWKLTKKPRMTPIPRTKRRYG